MVTTPTAAEFKTRYPAFNSVSDDMVDAILSEATYAVSDDWLERDQSRAVKALAAHMLTLEGEPAVSNGEVASGLLAGQVIKRRKVGDVEIELGSMSNDLKSTYASTPYGQLFEKIRRGNNAGFRVV